MEAASADSRLQLMTCIQRRNAKDTVQCRSVPSALRTPLYIWASSTRQLRPAYSFGSSRIQIEKQLVPVDAEIVVANVLDRLIVENCLELQFVFAFD